MSEIEVGGLKIAYYEAGVGRDVILLHGWGAGKESMMPIANLLKGSFHVIVPDFPGCGGSDEPTDPWNVSNYSEFLKEFISKIEIKPFAAIGHSNGGRVLIRSCSDWFKPEKLILIDSAGIKKKHGPIYYIKVYGYKIGKAFLSLPVFKKTGLKERLMKNAGSDDYKNSTPVMRATMSKLLAEDLTAKLKHIKCETLLIWGNEDTATPISQGRIMEKEIEGAGLVEINGGHFSYLDNFAKAGGAINYFLTH